MKILMKIVNVMKSNGNNNNINEYSNEIIIIKYNK